ncbi:MAG: ABC transporter ATP-binding protein [Pseudomonadota bacterium]
MTAPDPAAGVAIEGVSFGYGATRVLVDVDLVVAKGEFFTFLGPSGSGKTTLLRLIAGFGAPSAGRILVGGRDLAPVPPWRRNVGMVFQNYALWPHMSVERNVAFGLEQRRLPRAAIARQVARMLDLVGLGALARRRPAQLSGGQQQRVALARTLVIEPEVLLLDEPLSNLDARLRVEMRSELKALQRHTGVTAIYVTHDQEEANAMADRIALIDRGRIQQVGTPVELYDRPANRFVASFLGTANLIEGEIALAGERAVFRAAGIEIALTGRPGPGPACLAFRPQTVALSPGPASSSLEGTVERREFLGGVVRYVVAVGRHRVVVDHPHRRGRPALEAGSPVALALDPQEVSVLKD